MADLNAIKKSFLFLDWPDSDLKKLVAICKTHNLSPGEILFSEGESSAAFYFLSSGTMGIKKFSRNGEEAVSNFGSGSLFGELAMLYRGGHIDKRSASAQAIEASTVLEIPYKEFNELLDESPEASHMFYKNLTFDLANRIRKTTEELAGIRALRLRHT